MLHVCSGVTACDEEGSTTSEDVTTRVGRRKQTHDEERSDWPHCSVSCAPSGRPRRVDGTAGLGRESSDDPNAALTFVFLQLDVSGLGSRV